MRIVTHNRSFQAVGLGLALCFCGLTGRADERLWLSGTINGHEAHLIFDTGADRLILFRKGAQRLGLRVRVAQDDLSAPPGAVVLGSTEPCDVTFLHNSFRKSLGVVEMPSFLDLRADGVLGWGSLRKNVVSIDASSLKVEFLENDPALCDDWISLPLRADSRYLALQILHHQGPAGVVLVDTGFTGGVAVPPRRWQAWQPAHPNEPMTLDSYFMPGAGLVVKEETWAGAIAFGPLLLTEVPLMEANLAQVALGSSGYEGSLGLAALKRLDLIVDGRREVAFLRLKKTPPPPYQHNRLGAVFVPSDLDSDQLVAKVTNHGPAHEAGICDGDVLLKIGSLDATKWRSDPAMRPLSQFWMQPPDTKLDLTLKRQDGTFRTTVMLRQILPPEGTPSDKFRQRS